MFNRITVFASALALVAPMSVQAAPNPSSTAVWEGDINKSCSIEAIKEGTLTLDSGSSISQSLLTSVGASPAQLQVDVIGGTAQVGFTGGSSRVERDGTNLLVPGASFTHHVKFQNQTKWNQTFQNTHHQNNYNNQERVTVNQGRTVLSADTKTNAHLNQGKNVIQKGEYVIKTTYECIAN